MAYTSTTYIFLMLVPTAPGFRKSSRTCPGSSRPRASKEADRGKHAYPESGLLQIAENPLHQKRQIRLSLLGVGRVIGASASSAMLARSRSPKNALHSPSSIIIQYNNNSEATSAQKDTKPALWLKTLL